jgi:hypothetical protein
MNNGLDLIRKVPSSYEIRTWLRTQQAVKENRKMVGRERLERSISAGSN